MIPFSKAAKGPDKNHNELMARTAGNSKRLDTTFSLLQQETPKEVRILDSWLDSQIPSPV